MASIELRAPIEEAMILRMAAVASDVGAARLLRPTPELELAAYIDLSLSQFVGEFANAISRTARTLFGNIAGDPISTGEVRLVTETGPDITRLLILSGGTIQSDGISAVDAAFRSSGERGFLGLPVASIPALEFELVVAEISLQSGSLIGKYAATLLGEGAALAALLFFVAPDYAEWRADRLTNHEIVRVTEHGRCSVDFAVEIDINALRDLAAKALVKPKSRQPEVMSDERRTCLTQVLLHLNNVHPGGMDGVRGSHTRQAEKAFAKREGISVSEIGKLPFYEALIAGVQRKRQ